jgi:type IV pilus assembly protein PilA
MHPNRRSPVRRSSAFLPIAVITALTILCVGCFIIWPAYAKLNKSRMYAQEVSALQAIQTVHAAQVRYRSQYDRYAKTLAELGPSAADLISADLASGNKQSYPFTMTGTPAGYTISAVPKSFGSTGSRTFYSDQALVVRENYGQEPATVNSKEVGSAQGQVE